LCRYTTAAAAAAVEAAAAELVEQVTSEKPDDARVVELIAAFEGAECVSDEAAFVGRVGCGALQSLTFFCCGCFKTCFK
jgi:hypothetical protein